MRAGDGKPIVLIVTRDLPTKGEPSGYSSTQRFIESVCIGLFLVLVGCSSAQIADRSPSRKASSGCWGAAPRPAAGRGPAAALFDIEWPEWSERTAG